MHHEVRKPFPRIDRMNRHDVFMGDGRSGPGLASEAKPRRAKVRQLRGEDLDRDDAAERRVSAFQHHAHPASANNLTDRVGAEEAYVPGIVGRIQESPNPRSRVPVVARGLSGILARRLADSAGPWGRKVDLADEKCAKVAPQPIVSGERIKLRRGTARTARDGRRAFLARAPQADPPHAASADPFCKCTSLPP